MARTQRKRELIFQREEKERKEKEKELEEKYKDVFDKIDEWFDNDKEFLELGPWKKKEEVQFVKSRISMKYVGEKLDISVLDFTNPYGYKLSIKCKKRDYHRERKGIENFLIMLFYCGCCCDCP
jgi:hypothetical protein